MVKPNERASDDDIRDAARTILAARYPIALTGAGMSVESGIPPFRGPGGLWTKYGEPPMNGFQRFMADPKKAWEERLTSATTNSTNRCRWPGRIRVISRWWSWSSWEFCAS